MVHQPTFKSVSDQKSRVMTISMSITRSKTRRSRKNMRKEYLLIIYSWSAVTRGAAIYGIEKSQHKNAIKTKPCPSNYGIATNEDYQTSWIKLEDLDLDDVLEKR